MADANEWTPGGAKQLGRIKRPETKEFDVAIVHPEGLGHHAITSSLLVGSKLAVLVITNELIVDEAHMPMRSGEITVDFEPDPMFESSSMKKLLDDWANLARGDYEGPTGTDITTYCVPWDNRTPEGAYLNSNTAFAEGATLPRGKCRRKFGNKPITKTKFKNCKVSHMDFGDSDNNIDVEFNIEFGEIDAK